MMWPDRESLLPRLTFPCTSSGLLNRMKQTA